MEAQQHCGIRSVMNDAYETIPCAVGDVRLAFQPPVGIRDSDRYCPELFNNVHPFLQQISSCLAVSFLPVPQICHRHHHDACPDMLLLAIIEQVLLACSGRAGHGERLPAQGVPRPALQCRLPPAGRARRIHRHHRVLSSSTSPVIPAPWHTRSGHLQPGPRTCR